MKVIKAPSKINTKGLDAIFLAGSIENGEAENWQAHVETLLEGYDVVILNPRRDDWDTTLEQSANNKEFRKQVKWERKAIDEANFKLFYFDPKTLSPVSLLELGEFGDNYDTYVVCPDGFHRKGNIEIFCEEKEIPMFNTLEEAIEEIKENIEREAGD